MAFFTGPIYSHALQLETQLSVILPHDTKSHHSHDLADGIEPRRTPKTLFLLHGLSDSSTMWERKTAPVTPWCSGTGIVHYCTVFRSQGGSGGIHQTAAGIV